MEDIYDPLKFVPIETFSNVLDSHMDTMMRHNIALDILWNNGLMTEYSGRCKNEITG